VSDDVKFIEIQTVIYQIKNCISENISELKSERDFLVDSNDSEIDGDYLDSIWHGIE
jgi:hypothetical protein